jgi:ribosomal protein S12 methylthiotransferase accessory factor
MTFTLASRMQANNRRQPGTRTLLFIGDRTLARDLRVALAEQAPEAIELWETLEQVEAADSDRALVVGLSAHCQPGFDRQAQRWCTERGLAYLRVSVWQHEAVVGPFVSPEQPGCVACAEVRRIRALTTEAEHELAFLACCEQDADGQVRAANPWLTLPARRVLGLTVAREIAAFLQQGAPAMGWRTVRFLRLRALTNRVHAFIPDPNCPCCAHLPDDSAELAHVQFRPHPHTSPHSYRVRALLDDLAALQQRFVDHRLGLQVRSLDRTAATFATMVIHSFEYPYIKQDTGSTGVGFSFQASCATAILEALERTCGFLPRARRTVVYGSYEQLHTHAINPQDFGLLSEPIVAEREPDLASLWRAYRPDLPFHWVWGYSCKQGKPVLVPEQIAYYGTHRRPGRQLFVAETSNGCAIGGSLEDAMVHGLCEVIERDAFFLTWYGRLPVPALDWRTTRDTDLLLAIERITRMTGFTFHAFDCTTDLGVPVVLVLAVNAREEFPRVLLGAGAHLDPDRALAAAFLEAAVVIPQNLHPSPATRERGKRLVADSSLIQTIDDHLLAGAMPEAFARFSFLLAERPVYSMQARFAAWYARQPAPDLTQDLRSLIEQVAGCGHDVIVVDQTSPELRAAQFWCVRVLAPGLIPLTFGHRFRRTRHLDRLYRIPQELGYTDHRLCAAELNPDPHAFP